MASRVALGPKVMFWSVSYSGNSDCVVNTSVSVKVVDKNLPQLKAGF